MDLGAKQQFEIVSESKRSNLNVSKSNISTLKASSSTAQINTERKSKENLSAIAGKKYFLIEWFYFLNTLKFLKFKTRNKITNISLIFFQENLLKKEMEGKILVKDPEKVEKVAQV